MCKIISFLVIKKYMVHLPTYKSRCTISLKKNVAIYRKEILFIVKEMITQTPTTSGTLNVINEKYGCSTKKNSVPVMQLIRHHNPQTNAHLAALIAAHTENGAYRNCECGCKSQGTVEDFGKNLYKANLHFFNSLGKPNEAKSLEECEVFMHTLFITNSLKGNNMETEALAVLKKLLPPEFTVAIASSIYDFKYSVDLIITKDNGELCGVQVKPVSYKNIPDTHEVKQLNIKKNKLYGKPVFYIYYDKSSVFINTTEIFNLITTTN